jgi:metallophosphoesterase (TIGR00282 family)
MIKVLFFGDIFGRSGRKIIISQLPLLKKEFRADLCLANCENLASGRGITERTVLELFDAGIDAFTSGNHLWDKKDAIPFLEHEKRIIKPHNYPAAAVGNPWHILSTPQGEKLAIICLTGQVYMQACESPWRHIQEILPEIKKKSNAVLLDFHAEATGEKKAMAYFLDGMISAVLGTHTHVQTADEQILPLGTAYISDVGMNGPHDSIIGVQKELILKKTLTGMPVRFEPAKSGNQINAVYLEIDATSGKTDSIIRIKRNIEEPENE